MTTPATAELLRMARDWQAIAQREGSESLGTPEGAARLAEAKRYRLLADALAAMAKTAEGANSSTQQSGEAVAWLWEYIGKDPYPASLYKGKYIARSLVEMDPNSPPHPGTWRPVRPLYTRPQQEPLTEDDVSAGYSRADCDYDCYMAFECGVRFAEEKHGIGSAPRTAGSTRMPSRSI